jgi:hypothetical protein
MPSRPKASRPETESKGYLDERPRIFNYERREADPDDFVTFLRHPSAMTPEMRHFITEALLVR